MWHLPLAVCIAMLPAARALAQQPPGLQPFVSVTPLYQFDTDLDSGGEFGVGGSSPGWACSRRWGKAPGEA
jgi:hypothetical protein